MIAYGRGDATVLVNARAVEVKATVAGVSGSRDLLSQATQQGDTVRLAPYGMRVLRKNAAY